MKKNKKFVYARKLRRDLCLPCLALLPDGRLCRRAATLIHPTGGYPVCGRHAGEEDRNAERRRGRL
jgi:hypothetical protein